MSDARSNHRKCSRGRDVACNRNGLSSSNASGACSQSFNPQGFTIFCNCSPHACSQSAIKGFIFPKCRACACLRSMRVSHAANMAHAACGSPPGWRGRGRSVGFQGFACCKGGPKVRAAAHRGCGGGAGGQGGAGPGVRLRGGGCGAAAHEGAPRPPPAPRPGAASCHLPWSCQLPPALEGLHCGALLQPRPICSVLAGRNATFRAGRSAG